MNYSFPFLYKHTQLRVLLTALISLSSLLAFAVNGTMYTSTQVCVGATSVITFTGTGGTAPYTFTYSDGNSTQTVTTSGTSSSVDVSVTFTTVAVVPYNLISVQDASSTTVSLSQEILVTVHANPVIDAGADMEVCEGGLVYFNPTGGVTYIWNLGVVNGVPVAPSESGYYTVIGSDANGCQGTDQVYITVIPSVMPTVTALIDSSDCLDNGSILLTASGPNAPYTIQWSNGSNATMLTSLPAGTYSATIGDALGCVFPLSYVVPESLVSLNCGKIKGSVHYDTDESCATSANDIPLPNRIVIANPGNYIAHTDQYGNYELYVPNGTYTVEHVMNFPAFAPACTDSYSVTVANGQIITGIDFQDSLADGLDFSAYAYAGEIRPGFVFSFQPKVNDLCYIGIPQNVEGWFTLPAGVTMTAWSYPHTISNDTVHFEINGLYGTWYPQFAEFIADNVELGDIVTFCTGVAAHPEEGNLSNNVFCVSKVVIGSYDPNDKTMYLNGLISDSTILETDETLEYLIRFQNTGTADAINVFVLDTISSKLDLASVQLIATSHPCQFSVLDGRILKFDFPLIHLPDSNANEPQSHGYIRYKIKQDAGNTLGTLIQNTAYIYFDFNEAVITNTTHHEITAPLGIEKLAFSGSINVYPNPADSKVTVKSGSAIRTIRLYSLNGQLLQQEYPKNSDDFTLNISEISQGMYLLNIETEQGITVKKIQIR